MLKVWWVSLSSFSAYIYIYLYLFVDICNVYVICYDLLSHSTCKMDIAET